MKRYFEEHNGPSNMVEYPDGNWVKAVDADAAVEALEQNFKDRVTEEVKRAALALLRCTPAERAVLDALRAISDVVIEANADGLGVFNPVIRAELARRDAAKGG